MHSTKSDREIFGQRLQRLRKERGIMQHWVAERIGVRTQTVSGWERGAFAPDRAKAQALEELLDGNGELLDALGYSAEPELSLDAKIEHWKQELVKIRAELAHERDERAKLERKVADLTRRQSAAEDVMTSKDRARLNELAQPVDGENYPTNGL